MSGASATGVEVDARRSMADMLRALEPPGGLPREALSTGAMLHALQPPTASFGAPSNGDVIQQAFAPAIITDTRVSSSAAESWEERGFAPKCLMLCNLPYREPKPADLVNGTWVRTAGKYTLEVTGSSKGIPYGSYPRLFAFWLTKEVLRTKSTSISMGNSFAEFCRAMNVDRSRGKNGAGMRMIEQATRFLEARIIFRDNDTSPAARGKTTQSRNRFLPVSHQTVEFWTYPDDSAQRSLFGGCDIVLTKEFFDYISTNFIKFDMQALLSIKDSALSLDIFQWLAYRLPTIPRDKPLSLTWTDLEDQYGGQFAETKFFAVTFRQRLKEVLRLYPAARVEEFSNGRRISTQGLTFYHSPSPTQLTSTKSL